MDTLLVALQSSTNSERQAAEVAYEQALQTNLAQTAQAIVGTVRSNPNPMHRTFAAVLLKRVISPAQGRWQTLDDATQTALKAEIIATMTEVSDAALLRQLCHSAAGLLVKEGGSTWPELMQWAITAAQGAEPLRNEAGFLLLDKIGEYNFDLLAPHVVPLQPLLVAGMSGASAATQLAALKAGCSLVISLEALEQQQPLAESLLPVALQAVAAALGADELHARELLQSLVELATHAAKAFGAQLGATANAMLQVISHAELDPSTRQTAMEVLVTLCEQAASVVKGSADAVHTTVDALMRGMTEVDADESAWKATAYVGADKTDEFDEEEEVAVAADEALERVCTALGQSVVAPTVALVGQFAPQADWRMRRAALNAICAVGSCCSKFMKKQLKDVVPFAVQCVSDSQQRVRFAALECLATLSGSFPGTFQRVNKGLAVPAFIAALTDPANCERVKGHAAAAVTTFAHPEQCPASCLAAHLDPLLSALIAMLQDSSLTVKEQSLTAVACIAEVSQADFGKYYDAFVPGLKSIIGSALGEDQCELRGKAMESLAMMADAVGPERFVADAQEVMTMIMGAKGSGGNSELDRYVSRSCARICKVMGEASAAFLPMLIPPLIEAAQADVGFHVEDVDSNDPVAAARLEEYKAKGLSSMQLDIRGMGEKRVFLNVAATQDKEEACRVLFEYAEALGVAFAPHVQAVAQATIPLIGYQHSANVRTSCGFIFGKLLECAVEFQRSQGQPLEPLLQLLTTGVTVLLDAVDKEFDDGTRVALCEAVSDTMCVCFQSGGLSTAADGSFAAAALVPPVEAVGKLVTAMLATARESLERRTKAMGELEGGAAEEELYEALELEDELMTNVVDSIGYSLKTLREGFLPIFDQLVAPFFNQFLAAGAPSSLTTNALCLYDDAIEFCGAAAHKYLPTVFPHFLAHMNDEELVLQQCSLYGIAKTAQFAQAFFAPHVAAVLPQLVALISAEGSRDEEHEDATENAIAAVGKILLFHKASVDVGQLLPLWLSWLPLKSDEMEAKVMHQQLLTYVQQQEPAIVAATDLLIRAMASALAGGAENDAEEAMDLLADSTKAGFVGAIRQMPRERLAAVGSQLPPMAQQALQEACS